MLFGSIRNLVDRELKLFPRLGEFRTVLKLARTEPFESLRVRDFPRFDGRLSFSQYVTKDERNERFETHRINWDLHMVMEGEERFAVSPVESLGAPLTPYDEAGDIEYYSGDAVDSVLLRRGYFILIAPWDAHKPGLTPSDKAPCRISKLVLKLPWG